jgi:hypothetical protein
MWLMPSAEPGRGSYRWPQILLTQLRENYKALCQSVALIAVGALAALLVVGFAHRRSPLPPGLQGAERIRQEVPLVKTRRKALSRTTTRQGAAKSPVTTKNALTLKSLKSPTPEKVLPGKLSLASSHQQVLSKSQTHSNVGGESGFVAKDTVTRYDDAAPAAAPK